MIKKMVSFKVIACVMVLLSICLIGCGKKKEDDLGTKIIKAAGNEVVGRLTGEFKNTAELALSYDHEALGKAVNNPNSGESRQIARKVNGQMEMISQGIMQELFKSKDEFQKTMSIAQDMSLMAQVEKDKREGKDISRNFILVDKKKYLAMTLATELTTSVHTVCQAISERKTDGLDYLWQEVLQSRERVNNFIEGKPVIYGKAVKRQNVSSAGSSATATTNSNNATTGAQPIISGAIAGTNQSSYDNEDGYHHDAAKTVDGDIKSCWAEGVKGLGIGEFIQINFNGTYKVSGLNIWSGHQKSQDLFYKNARPVAIRVIGSDGSNQVYPIEDRMGMQRVNFISPINVSNIRIVVEKVARGTKYEDTCIAEVGFF